MSDLEDPVFRAYLFYISILGLKMLLMSVLTGHYRFSKRIFANPEDLPLKPNSKVKYDDPKIERIRRAHRNDLENIHAFVAAGWMYCMTNPDPWLAVTLFRTFTIVRILHTMVYAVVVVRQPARVLCFVVGVAVTVYMFLCSLFYFTFVK